MGKRSTTIRIGDTVRVLSPYIFIRCGYELSLEDGVRFVKKNMMEEVIAIYGKVSPDGCFRSVYPFTEDSVELQEIINALAFAYIKSRNFGGNKRIIKQQVEPSLSRDKLYQVTGKRTCVTGIRVKAYFGEEYEPPFLSHYTRHNILYIIEIKYPYGPLDPVYPILQENCQLIKE